MIPQEMKDRVKVTLARGATHRTAASGSHVTIQGLNLETSDGTPEVVVEIPFQIVTAEDALELSVFFKKLAKKLAKKLQAPA